MLDDKDWLLRAARNRDLGDRVIAGIAVIALVAVIALGLTGNL